MQAAGGSDSSGSAIPSLTSWQSKQVSSSGRFTSRLRRLAAALSWQSTQSKPSSTWMRWLNRNGSDWSEREPCGVAPYDRSVGYHALAYDAKRRTLLSLGGRAHWWRVQRELWTWRVGDVPLQIEERWFALAGDAPLPASSEWSRVLNSSRPGPSLHGGLSRLPALQWSGVWLAPKMYTLSTCVFYDNRRTRLV